MKVTTEGCLFGAWVGTVCKAPRTVLDVGTGTGLLSLMLAQANSTAQIDAVEVDGPAATEAQANFEACPWHERIQMIITDVQSFTNSQRYDLIIVNPPFYNQSQRSDSKSINRARHDAELIQPDLVDALCRLLHEEGEAFVLYPVREAKQFADLAMGSGLYLQRALQVYDSPGALPFRVMGQYGYRQVDPVVEDFYIKTGDGGYTPGFVKLLKDFYLHL